MPSFIDHPNFEKETASLERRFSAFNAGLESAKKIFQVHFHPVTPRQVIAPGKIHRIKDCEVFVIWKLEMAVKNLRPNQYPRVWFALRGGTIAFLCTGTHMENYDDGEMNRLAEARALELF